MKTRLTLGALLLAAAPLAFAQSTVDLTISGEIVPNACTPTLSGGGNIALGTFDLASLDPVNVTQTPGHPVTLSITCSGPVSIGYSIKDNRAASARVGMSYGLGFDGAGNQIGGYNIAITSVTADGSTAGLMSSADQGATWIEDSYHFWDNDTQTWRAVGTGTAPALTTTQVLELEVNPQIVGTNNLDFGSMIVIDGSSTFVMHYL
jgi:type 1 fimbria pilin